MSGNKATDQRPPFFAVEEAVIDDYNLPPLAGWLYVVIVRHINRKKNDAFPSVARLAKLANMSKASVIRYTRLLEDKHLIVVIREKDEAGESLVNHYQLLTATPPVAHSNDVVSNGNHPDSTQTPQVVADVAHNQKNLNQKKLTSKEPERAPIFGLFENLCGLSIHPMIYQDLKDAAETYPAEWIEAAFKEAAANNVRKWAYVLAILKRWAVEGVGSKNTPATEKFDPLAGMIIYQGLTPEEVYGDR